jgi:hypothetical protein
LFDNTDNRSFAHSVKDQRKKIMGHKKESMDLSENLDGVDMNVDSQPLKPWKRPVLFKKRRCEGKGSTSVFEVTEDEVYVAGTS